jgi:hypothetical protein
MFCHLPSSLRVFACQSTVRTSALRQRISNDKCLATSVSSFSSSSGMHLPITQFNEDEQMTRDAARQWAREVLKPIVRDMDNEEKLRPELIQSLFENGFMGMVRTNVCITTTCLSDFHHHRKFLMSIHQLYLFLISPWPTGNTRSPRRIGT